MPNPIRLALLALLAAALRAAPPFPQDGSDLRPDPAAAFGVLGNGVRYVVLPNHEPRDRVSLRLLVLSGSLEEKEGQRGLAHYLEHMAFNGSTRHPPGTLVEYFQRLGMSFGGDTNAYTSFDRTVFKIELPDTRPGTVGEGLGVLADMAGGLLLPPGMIAKERPIILSEKRTRDSPEYRQFVASFDFLLAGTLLPRRMPIGLQPVIERASRDDFEDLYNAWYRPERMIVIAVGDIAPPAAIARIRGAFGSLAGRAPARPEPALGHIVAALGLRTAYDPEPEAPATTVSIDVVTPYSYRPDTAAVRLGHLKRDLAVAMLNRRLSILAKKEGAPFTRAGAGAGENFNFFRDAGINVTCAPAQWAAALGVGERELRRALKFGFTAAELREASANLRNDLAQAAAGAGTRRSPELAESLADALAVRTVFTSPAQDLALGGRALDGVTPGDCSDALRAAFSAPGRYVMVSGNALIPGDAAAAISRAYQAAQAEPVPPPADEAGTAFAYADPGRPGGIAERRRVDDLDITLVRFANGVCANLKRTPFEANRIRIRLRVGAGRLTEPRDRPGLALFSDLAFAAGGLGRHSADDLQRILAGRTVGLDFATASDAFEFRASTNREDLLLQLRLLAAYLADPGYRPEALRAARKNIDEIYNELDHSPEGPLQGEFPRLLAGGDPRFGLPDRRTALSRTLDEEKAWLGPQLASGPVEIGIVGDLDVDEVLAALARTLGALPDRAPRLPRASEREVHFPPRPFAREFPVESAIPKATVALYWPTADFRDVRRTRRLNLLADVLNDRLRVKIREQMGGAYDPGAFSDPSDTFTDYGLIAAECVVSPDRAREIARSIRGIAGDLAARGVTPDELERARQPVLTSLRESARTNPYWLDAVLGNCQELPQRLDWARSRQADFSAITKADLDALARRYLAPDRAFQAIVRPAAAAGK